MSLQLKYDSLQQKYANNIKEIGELNDQIHNLCIGYNKEASGISTQIIKLNSDIVTIKENIVKTESDIISTNITLKQIPTEMRELLQSEETIYNNETSRISSKKSILEKDYKCELDKLDERRNTCAGEIKGLNSEICNLDTLAYNNIHLRHTWKTSIQRQLELKKESKKNNMNTTGKRVELINSLNAEIAEIRRNIEINKLAKYNANNTYYSLVDALEYNETKLDEVNSRLIALLSGESGDDFEANMTAIQREKSSIEASISGIKNDPIYNINSYLEGIQCEINDMLEQIKVIEYKINYYENEGGGGEGDGGDDGDDVTEISKQLGDLKVNRKTTQNNILMKQSELHGIENDIEILNDSYVNTHKILEEQLERAELRWNIMKTRVRDEALESRNLKQSQLDALKRKNTELNSNRLKSENMKTQLLVKLKSLMNVESSTKLIELRNSVIKLEQTNNLITKELELLKGKLSG
jgi:hypothetical protein